MRFILACVVMLGHFGNHGFYMIGGDKAVQIFYVISGFSMSIIFNEYSSYRNTKTFYISRILKLFPVYLIVAVISLTIYVVHYFILNKSNSLFNSLNQIPSEFIPISILLNFSIFFQDITPFVFFSNQEVRIVGISDDPKDTLLIDALILPQSWSLALELYFYALCPFFIKKNKIIMILILSSVSFLCVLVFVDLAIIDPWSYRFFPSQLYLFLMGVISHKFLYGIYLKIISENIKISYVLSASILFFILFNNFLFAENRSIVNSIFLNIIFLALPALYHTSKAYKFDSYLGRLSLPIYLLHITVYFLAVRICARIGLINELNIAIIAVSFTSILALLLDQMLIRKFDKIRYRWSGKIFLAH